MKIVLADERISTACLKTLELLGFFPILLPPHPALPAAIASHPDSLLFFSDGELFAPAEYCEYALHVFSDIREYLPNIKIHFTADTLGDKYPRDARMNAKVMGNKLLANIKTLSPAIAEFAKRKNYKIINTNQGYPACTTLAPSESFAITADLGIKKALSGENIDVTLIESCDISLPPYDCGFIGGASGVYKNSVFFIGDYKTHKNCDIIEEELKKRGFIPRSLSKEPLADLGGLIFLE